MIILWHFEIKHSKFYILSFLCECDQSLKWNLFSLSFWTLVQYTYKPRLSWKKSFKSIVHYCELQIVFKGCVLFFYILPKERLLFHLNSVFCSRDIHFLRLTTNYVRKYILLVDSVAMGFPLGPALANICKCVVLKVNGFKIVLIPNLCYIDVILMTHLHCFLLLIKKIRLKSICHPNVPT